MDNVVARLSNGHGAAKSLKGIYSICSAHPWVLAAAMQQAVDDGTPLLVESTSNQVDQYGGYTGMKPADFIRFAHGIAEQVGLPREERGDLKNIHHLRRDGRVRGFVNIGENRHADLAFHLIENF